MSGAVAEAVPGRKTALSAPLVTESASAPSGSGFDRDFLRLCGSGLRHRHLEHAVRDAGRDGVDIDSIGQFEAARERAVAALEPTIIPIPLLLFLVRQKNLWAAWGCGRLPRA